MVVLTFKPSLIWVLFCVSQIDEEEDYLPPENFVFFPMEI